MHFAPLLLLAACASHEPPPSEGDPTEGNDVVAVTEGSGSLELTAVITSRNSEVIHAESDGAIMKMIVHDDEYVHQGDPIAQLDVSELRSKLDEAKGNLARAEGEAGHASAMAQSAARKARLEARLARSGASSVESMRAAIDEQHSNDGEVGAAGGQISAAKATIQETQRLIDRANIKAPMDGIISSIKLHEGEAARKGMTLARVFDPTDLQVRTSLPRAKLELVKIGDRVELFYGTSGKVPVVVKQIIDNHDPAIDFVTVVGELDSNIKRPDDIHVGIFGHVRIADKGAAR